MFSNNKKEIILPFDREIIFSNHKNTYKKGIEKRQKGLLNKIPFLINFLDKDETIRLITTACSPTSSGEQFLTGWIFIYLKRSLLIFTNKRIFHILTKQDYSYRNSIAQLWYNDCKSIFTKGRNLVIEYKNGSREKFLYLSGKEKKKIKTILSSISFEGQPGRNQGRVHLCPRCRHDLEMDRYVCPNCSLQFKDKDEGRRISIIYPGGGYFYTRHPWLGVSDAVVETIFLVSLIVSIIYYFMGVQNSGFNVIFFAILLLIEKLVSVYHSNHFIKEYIPKEKEIVPLT
jgi:hypothetical protein